MLFKGWPPPPMSQVLYASPVKMAPTVYSNTAVAVPSITTTRYLVVVVSGT